MPPGPRVDFYLVAATGADAAARVACRLAEKAWRLGHRVFVAAGDPSRAAEVDALMWTFRDESFVPHELAGAEARWSAPVLIGVGDPPEGRADVLINLGEAVPLCAERCERLAEVVDPAEPSRDAARMRFRTYRDRGWELRSHEI